MCTWILERRFSKDFGCRIYKKTNIVSETLNQNFEIIIQDTDAIREEIPAKFDRVEENIELLTS